VRKKGKSRFGVPDSSLVGCGTVSTGKRRTGVLHSTAGSRSGRIMVFYLKTLVNFMLYQILPTYFRSHKDLKSPSLKLKQVSSREETLFFGFSGTTVSSFVLILNFLNLFFEFFSLNLCWKTPCFGSLYRCFPLKFSPN